MQRDSPAVVPIGGSVAVLQAVSGCGLRQRAAIDDCTSNHEPSCQRMQKQWRQRTRAQLVVRPTPQAIRLAATLKEGESSVHALSHITHVRLAVPLKVYPATYRSATHESDGGTTLPPLTHPKVATSSVTPVRVDAVPNA